MVKRYLEARRRVRYEPANVAADAARYVQARQYLGRMVVVCEDPEAFLGLMHKQWLRLSRLLQRRRSATTSAQKILEYTRAITHMQRVIFVAVAPHERPEATVFVVRADQLRLLPSDCSTLFLAAPVAAKAMARVLPDLAPASLVVDYADQLQLGDYGLCPKAELDGEVVVAWRRVAIFLAGQGIDSADLALTQMGMAGGFDDVLDVLLGVNEGFLQRAGAFQRALDLARPLRSVPKSRLEHYEAVVHLAARVQALTPGLPTAMFFQSVTDDTFFFNDRPQTSTAWADLIMRHQRAGRLNLARVLVDLAPTAGGLRQGFRTGGDYHLLGACSGF